MDEKVKSDPFDIADDIIEKVYPDIFKKGKGWGGEKRIQNWGILRNAIANKIFTLEAKVKSSDEIRMAEKEILIKEIEKNTSLEARIKELEEKTNFTYCAYCGATFPMDDSTEDVSRHIKTCDKHPMREAEARIKELEDARHEDAGVISMFKEEKHDALKRVIELEDGIRHLEDHSKDVELDSQYACVDFDALMQLYALLDKK